MTLPAAVFLFFTYNYNERLIYLPQLYPIGLQWRLIQIELHT